MAMPTKVFISARLNSSPATLYCARPQRLAEGSPHFADAFAVVQSAFMRMNPWAPVPNALNDGSTQRHNRAARGCRKRKTFCAIVDVIPAVVAHQEGKRSPRGSADWMILWLSMIVPSTTICLTCGDTTSALPSKRRCIVAPPPLRRIANLRAG